MWPAAESVERGSDGTTLSKRSYLDLTEEDFENSLDWLWSGSPDAGQCQCD